MQSNNQQGYLCPKCIEWISVIHPADFCCAGRCFCCNNETESYSHKYCYDCSFKKTECYDCGLNILDGDGSVNQIEDFFKNLWFDEKRGNEIFMICEDANYDFFLEDLSNEELEKIKQETFENILNQAKKDYSGKTREEILEIIKKYR